MQSEKSNSLINEDRQCPDGSLHVFTSNWGWNYAVCENCGIVKYKEDMGDNKPIIMTDDFSRKIGGMEPITFGIAKNTIISKKDDKSGKFRKIIRWDNRLSGTEKNLSDASWEISRLGEIVGFGEYAIEIAFKAFKWAYSKGFCKFQNQKLICAAIVEYAARILGLPIILYKIANNSDFTVNQISRALNRIVGLSKLKIPVLPPQRYITGMISNHKLDKKVEDRTTRLVDFFYKIHRGFAGNHIAVICGALHVAIELFHPSKKVTKQVICKTYGIDLGSLSSRIEQMVSIAYFSYWDNPKLLSDT